MSSPAARQVPIPVFGLHQAVGIDDVIPKVSLLSVDPEPRENDNVYILYSRGNGMNNYMEGEGLSHLIQQHILHLL
jgi:hypothetical protein